MVLNTLCRAIPSPVLEEQAQKKASITGASLQGIKGILGGMRAGEFVMFSDIRAVGPSGPVFLENVSGMLQ